MSSAKSVGMFVTQTVDGDSTSEDRHVMFGPDRPPQVSQPLKDVQCSSLLAHSLVLQSAHLLHTLYS